MAAHRADQALRAAREAFARDDIKTALTQGLAALSADPAEIAAAALVLELLSRLDGYRLPEAATAALRRWAGDARLDPGPWPRIARNVLAADARWAALERDPAAADHDWFYTEPLLLAALERTTVADEALERLLTRLRRALTFAVARDGRSEVLARHPQFAAALARQCVAVRHVWLEQSDERAALARIRRDARVGRPERAVLSAMYLPLGELDDDERAALPPPLRDMVAERQQERALAERLPQLTPIGSGVSDAVRAQYEAFPYPPWRTAPLNAPLAWPTMVARLVGPTPAPVPTTEPCEVLIAGCGTGRSACLMASLLPEARILAVDLSRASLGYAARKARELGLRTIEFGVADIQHLGTLDRRFHLIECGGVLHHMADPAAGLRVLTGLLRPGGLINLALYSERARQPIVAARAFVAERGFADDIAGMRAARAVIFALPADHPVRRITRRTDFYSADGLHDLVFNAHEVRFTPAGLKPLIAGAGLTFLGFRLDTPGRMQAYVAANPADPLGSDLDRWEEFDKLHTDTFIGMMNMWLQKPP